ncbi:BnaAnng40600D [Brassica napus]|uniref:Uncharacterized protein n=2 Tax=Brassica TaxID=3705 RepID=A0A3P6B0C6_BRAOL|nr:unnamed protein product [Brassica napus]CDY72305.1 BnaAnng40600D [Brassica napus]VDC99756.1 unnamed protein product [Brassica oleracea]
MPFETSSKHLFHWDIKPMKADCGNTDRIFEFITIFESGCVANHGVRLSSSVQRRQQW